MTEPEPIPYRPPTKAEAAALASAVRLRIIRLTYRRALTNREIAERLGKDPATTLYHVRKLVDTGFLRAQPVRRGTRGSREIPYLSTGLSWRLRDEDRRRLWGEEVKQAAFEAFLGEVGEAGIAEVEQSRLILTLDEREQVELKDRMSALLDEYADREPTANGSRIALYFAVYPSP